MVHEPGINPNCEGSMNDNITGFRSISITKPSATLDGVDVKEMDLRSLLMSSIVEALGGAGHRQSSKLGAPYTQKRRC